MTSSTSTLICEVVKESSTFNAAVERVGYVFCTDAKTVLISYDQNSF
ncbi:hypothetical protein T12_8048 [Trichinella patagoniensis]|uniref:Uncharacterized protein n=1 Tax=Trichinella patagoniensis TaxID=990121 RepID=A0A0V0YKI6_9BILA|nr:hypothetical protein T12_8048 [Trichinella patagoniensis]